MAIDRLVSVMLLRIRSLFRGATVDRELDEELTYHIGQETAAGIARGLSPGQARRAALRAMGGLQQRTEECRDTRGWSLIDDTLGDCRFAIRSLWRRPGFSLVAITALALGIGANTAMFAIVNGVLLQPLPFPEPDRIVVLSSAPSDPILGRALGLSEAQYLDFRRGDTLFESVAVFAGSTANVTGTPEPVRVSLANVTPEFFSVLRELPALGRTFVAGDDNPAHGRVVVLGDGFWRSQFAADPGVIGRSIHVDGVSHQIVGVAKAGFSFPDETEAWKPLEIRLDTGNSFTRPVIGRLKAGASVEQAQAELESLTPRPSGPDGENWRIAAFPLKDRVVGQSHVTLSLLAGAVVFVLLIACANVANLFLIRTAERERELAVRTALGAGRRRLVRQLFVESAVVALAGGLGGILLAQWALPALIALAPPRAIPRVELIQIDGRVLAFTLALSLATALAFGLLPAARATRRRSLVPSTRTSTRGQDRVQSLLVIAEVALALVLLTGAGLMIKSFLRISAVETGFTPADALTMTLDLPAASYRSAPDAQRFERDAVARLSVVPGVAAVGAINWLPFGTAVIQGDFALDGGRPIPPRYMVDKPAASPGYFRALGIRLLKGREFTDRDDARAERVAIVSESAGRELWPAESAVGQRISLRENPKPEDWLTVVGVVDDVRQQSLTGQRTRPAVYQPYAQVQRLPFLSHVTFVVRTTSDPANVVPGLRAALRGVDANLPVPPVVSMDTLLARRTAAPRFQARLLSLFALVALLLTVIGVYGVLAYSVSQRTREFGIRMAMGADPANVLGMVVRRTMRLAGLGILLGTGGALALMRVAENYLYLFDVRPADPPTLAAVAAVLLAAALAAAWVPAWRATRVSPTIALRAE